MYYTNIPECLTNGRCYNLSLPRVGRAIGREKNTITLFIHFNTFFSDALLFVGRRFGDCYVIIIIIIIFVIVRNKCYTNND